MEFKKVLLSRYSTRNFQDKQISQEVLERILKFANLSPSAGNLQARKVVIVQDKETKEKIAQICFGQQFIAKAPLIIIVFAHLKESEKKYGWRGRTLYAIQDATIFSAYLQLVAVDEGLDTCWIGAFDEQKLNNLLNIPDDFQPISVIPLGYGKNSSHSTSRKTLEELILKKI